MQQNLPQALFVYFIVFKKGTEKCHFETCGKFLFCSYFNGISFIGFLLKKLSYVFQQIFAISDHFEKIGVKGVKNHIFKISHRILMGFVANDSLWKMQQQLPTNVFVNLTIFEIQGTKRGCKASFCAVWEIIIFHQISMGFFSLGSSQRKIW